MEGPVPEQPLFDVLEPATRATLEEISQRRSYDVGEAVIREGESGREVFVLLSGRCDVAVGGNVVNSIDSGELFGEIGHLGEGVRTASVLAAEPCEMLRISSEGLRRVMRESPGILNVVLKTLAARTKAISNREAEARSEHLELQKVQRRLLPHAGALRSSKRFSLEVHWTPLTYASGDYCDVHELGPERYLVAIGDVMGHGARTAPTLAAVRGQLRELAGEGRSPAEMLLRVDEHLQEHGPRGIHVTMAVGVLDGNAPGICFGCAGHPPPAIYRGGGLESISVTPGPPLGYGLGRQLEFTQAELPLQAEDRVLFFTDGLSEARRGPRGDTDLLGEERLRAMFADVCRNVGRGVLGPLLTAVDGFRRGYPVQDDATALLIHVDR